MVGKLENFLLQGETDRQTQTQRERESSNSKTLFYKEREREPVIDVLMGNGITE